MVVEGNSRPAHTFDHCLPEVQRSVPLSVSVSVPLPLGTFTFVRMVAVWQHPVEDALEDNFVAPPALHLRASGGA